MVFHSLRSLGLFVMTTRFCTARTPMSVYSTEDCISIHRHVTSYSWAQQHAVSGAVVRAPATRNYLALAWFRRKVLEHLGYAFVEILFILLGFVGEHTFGAPPPNQLLRLSVV